MIRNKKNNIRFIMTLKINLSMKTYLIFILLCIVEDGNEKNPRKIILDS